MASNGRIGSTPIRGTKRLSKRSLFLFMYAVYLLYSDKCNRYYVGYSADIHERLLRHNTGKVTATRNCRPYRICEVKIFDTQAEAIAEEARIKRQKSRKYIEFLIAGNW